MTLDKLIDILQRRIDRINKVGERTGEVYSEIDIYILKYLNELKEYKEDRAVLTKELNRTKARTEQ